MHLAFELRKRIRRRLNFDDKFRTQRDESALLLLFKSGKTLAADPCCIRRSRGAVRKLESGARVKPFSASILPSPFAELGSRLDVAVAGFSACWRHNWIGR